jgi:replicative DNA helicase
MPKSDPLDLSGLPQAMPAERMILGSLINGGLDFHTCRATLSVDDFAIEAHRTIYRKIEQMCLVGVAVDHATVALELRNSNELESVGGLGYLVDLDSGTPRLPHFDEYVSTVKTKSILRKTVIVADKIRNEAILERGDPEELLGRAESMLVQLGLEARSSEEFRTPKEVIMSAGNLQNYLERRKRFGIPTGFDRLDRMTCGMRPGQLWVLAAFTAGGKSTFARNIALNAALRGNPSAFITLEMSEDEVTDGLICAVGGIDSQVIRRGLDLGRDKTRAAASQVADLPIYIRDRGVCTIPKVHAALRKLKAERGITFAIIDYLQLMTVVGRFDNRTNEVSHFSRGLKNIAVDLKIPIVALSQFKRVDAPRRPQLSDLRESGSIEQDANVVILLFSTGNDADVEVCPTEVIVAKQRNGPIGTIRFGFHKKHGVFREMSESSNGSWT